MFPNRPVFVAVSSPIEHILVRERWHKTHFNATIGLKLSQAWAL
jgi:hypothetical protein